MNVGQLELILYDTYLMDISHPPLFGKWLDAFKATSYFLWAVDELMEYVEERLFPRTYGSIEEFYSIICDFMATMNKYSNINTNTCLIFQTANILADNVLDIIHSMK